MPGSPLRFFTHDRLDLVVKYRFFESLSRGKQTQDESAMYAKHILARTRGVEPGNPAKITIDNYFTEAANLFRSMSKNGFDQGKPIPVDQWGRLRDGAHRVACAAVLGCEIQLVYRKVRFPFRQWGIDWFLANGFNREYVNGLLDHLNLITGYSNSAGHPRQPDLSES